MKTFQFGWQGVSATVYLLDKREEVPRHKHEVDHNTCVIAGSTYVRIFDVPFPSPIISRPGEGLILPAAIDHEIKAMEDGTIILNMIAVGAQTYDYQAPGEPGKDGGVALHEDQP